WSSSAGPPLLQRCKRGGTPAPRILERTQSFPWKVPLKGTCSCAADGTASAAVCSHASPPGPILVDFEVLALDVQRHSIRDFSSDRLRCERCRKRRHFRKRRNVFELRAKLVPLAFDAQPVILTQIGNSRQERGRRHVSLECLRKERGVPAGRQRHSVQA